MVSHKHTKRDPAQPRVARCEGNASVQEINHLTTEFIHRGYQAEIDRHAKTLREKASFTKFTKSGEPPLENEDPEGAVYHVSSTPLSHTT